MAHKLKYKLQHFLSQENQIHFPGQSVKNKDIQGKTRTCVDLIKYYMWICLSPCLFLLAHSFCVYMYKCVKASVFYMSFPLMTLSFYLSISVFLYNACMNVCKWMNELIFILFILFKFILKCHTQRCPAFMCLRYLQRQEGQNKKKTSQYLIVNTCVKHTYIEYNLTN